MHPRFDQLLSTALEEEVAAHLRECAECRAAADSAQHIAARLRELPVRTTAPDRWPAVRAALLLTRTSAQSARHMRRPGWLLPAASALLVAVAVLITVSSQGPRQPSHSQSASIENPRDGGMPVHAAPAALVAESQRLEAVLASLPADARLTRAGTALTVADLENRIRWVDYRLDLASEAGINPRQADLLWRERVELLNSLVAVRYADARTRAF
jgi:hypothetical protein